MIVLHRVLILLAVVTGIVAVVARVTHWELLMVVTPSAWLRLTGLLLLYAIALMLAQIAEIMRARSKSQSSSPPQT